MHKTIITSAIILLTPSITMAEETSYPLTDRDFLKSNYCYFLSKAPRLELDFSNEEKKAGEHMLYRELNKRNLPFPSVSQYEKLKYKYIKWASYNFIEKHDGHNLSLDWYKFNCLKN